MDWRREGGKGERDDRGRSARTQGGSGQRRLMGSGCNGGGRELNHGREESRAAARTSNRGIRVGVTTGIGAM